MLGFLASAPFAVKYIRQPARTEAVPISFSINPPGKSAGFNQLAISPDGSNLAFNALIDGKLLMFLRPMNSLSARMLPGTEGAAGFMFGRRMADPDLPPVTESSRVNLADGPFRTSVISSVIAAATRAATSLFLSEDKAGGNACSLPGLKERGNAQTLAQFRPTDAIHILPDTKRAHPRPRGDGAPPRPLPPPRNGTLFRPKQI
ncbi:MAG: hypothetical protein IPK58_15240 [Acidobacteria bacterium]|nr:hypothetical protein [Acidobacteriota bacterium]